MASSKSKSDRPKCPEGTAASIPIGSKNFLVLQEVSKVLSIFLKFYQKVGTIVYSTVGPYPTCGPIVSLTALEECNGGGAVDELSVGRE